VVLATSHNLTSSVFIRGCGVGPMQECWWLEHQFFCLDHQGPP
jgi:hypothetical protein